MAPTTCPACSGTEFTPEGKAHCCTRCGALIAEHMYFGDSLSLVSSQWDTEDNPEQRYFDLSGVSSKGPYRRHGWFNPVTRRITQVG